ncbi:MAG: hypothetical protein ACI83I_002877 [Bacteroidia bacterium]|jgi:hypothetical protein
MITTVKVFVLIILSAIAFASVARFKGFHQAPTLASLNSTALKIPSFLLVIP